MFIQLFLNLACFHSLHAFVDMQFLTFPTRNHKYKTKIYVKKIQNRMNNCLYNC